MLSTVPTNTKGTKPSSRGIEGVGSLSPSILTRTWNNVQVEQSLHYQLHIYISYILKIVIIFTVKNVLSINLQFQK